MSVGIMDADFSTYTLVPFNLEAMKLSSYYNRKNEIVVLSNKFTPERHQKFFYLKDYEDGIYPKELLTTPNVEYYGFAFSNNVYHPMPLEIERCKPDTSLYERFGHLILESSELDLNKRQKIFQNLMTAEHCRLSLDGKTIWNEYGKQFKSLYNARNLIFHDYDLNAIDGGLKEVQSIYSYNVQNVIGVDVVDDYTVRINLNGEAPFFEYYLTF